MKLVLVTTLAVAALAAPVAAHGTAQPSSTGEVRIVGKITKLTTAKVTVRNTARVRTFVIPSTLKLGKLRVGNRVEAEGKVVRQRLVLRTIHREDSSADDRGGDDRGGHGADDGPGHD